MGRTNCGRFVGLVAALALTIGLAAPALSDVVRLKSGDVVTGEIKIFDDDDLTIDPEFTDEIKIELKHIASIESTKPMVVSYEDGTEKTGYLVIDPNGRTMLRDTAPGEKPVAEAGGTIIDLGAVDSIEEVKTYYSYVANLEFGLNVAKGNTDNTNANLSGTIAPSWGKNTIALGGRWNRSKSDGELNVANWRLGAQYERDLTRNWFTFATNTYDHDSFQDLDLRVTGGAGMGYNFKDDGANFKRVSLAGAYVKENYSGSSADRTYAALVWTTKFDQDLFHPDISFYHNDALTIGLTEPQFVAQTEQGLMFDLINDFYLKLAFEFDYNREPADGAKTNDYRYLVKLGYDFSGDQNDWWQ